MHAVKTFGRRPAGPRNSWVTCFDPDSSNPTHLRRCSDPPGTLGAGELRGETPATAVPSCAFSSYLGDAPEPSSMTHGTKTALIGVGLVGVGWLLGGIVPVVGRAIGSLAGAAVAGGVAYAGYSSWQTDGGTTHQPGSCGAK
jgi:hypothetical protein